MRRLLIPVFRPIGDWARDVAVSWNAFWFTPADPTLLGVLRILTGLMLLYTHAVWGLVLADFFGPASWLDGRLMATIQQGSHAFSFWWLVPPDSMGTAYVASMAVLLCFTLGLWTRVTSVLSLIVALSFVHRATEAMFGLDQINVMLTLYLAIGPSGNALSLERLLAVRRGEGPAHPEPSEGANLALRLINVHMCVIYFFAGISKLQGEAWWNGHALWQAVANLEYQSMDMTWLAWHPWLINIATHVSVLWEISFCFLIWRPRFRVPVLLGSIVLHLGIGACLGMWTFGLIMLVGCASFLPTEAVGRVFANGFRRRTPLAEGSTPLVVSMPLINGRPPVRIEWREPTFNNWTTR